MSRRTDRVSQLVRAEVARILCQQTTDPRLRLVTVTHVRVSPDLGNAQVYWSCLSGDDEENVVGSPRRSRVPAAFCVDTSPRPCPCGERRHSAFATIPRWRSGPAQTRYYT